MQARSLLLAIVFAPLLALAEQPPREFSYPTMKIIVEMPERQKLEIEVDDRDVDRFAKSKYGYRIIDWVQAALGFFGTGGYIVPFLVRCSQFGSCRLFPFDE